MASPFHTEPHPIDCADVRIEAGALVLGGGGLLYRCNTGEWLFKSAPLIMCTELKLGKRGILTTSNVSAWVRTMDVLVVTEEDLEPALSVAKAGGDAKRALRDEYHRIYVARNAGQRARDEIASHRETVRGLRQARKELDH